MIQFRSYLCAKCLLSGSSLILWETFNYVIEGKEVHIQTKLAICEDCNTFVPAESEEQVRELFGRDHARCLNCAGEKLYYIK